MSGKPQTPNIPIHSNVHFVKKDMSPSYYMNRDPAFIEVDAYKHSSRLNVSNNVAMANVSHFKSNIPTTSGKILTKLVEDKMKEGGLNYLNSFYTNFENPNRKELTELLRDKSFGYSFKSLTKNPLIKNLLSSIDLAKFEEEKAIKEAEQKAEKLEILQRKVNDRVAERNQLKKKDLMRHSEEYVRTPFIQAMHHSVEKQSAQDVHERQRDLHEHHQRVLSRVTNTISPIEFLSRSSKSFTRTEIKELKEKKESLRNISSKPTEIPANIYEKQGELRRVLAFVSEQNANEQYEEVRFQENKEENSEDVLLKDLETVLSNL